MATKSELSCTKSFRYNNSSSFSSYPVRTPLGGNERKAKHPAPSPPPPPNFNNSKTDEKRARFQGQDQQKLIMKQKRILHHSTYHHDDALPSPSDSFNSNDCTPQYDNGMPPLPPHEVESLQDRLQQALIERDEALYKVDEYKSILSSLLSGIRILTRRMKKVHTFEVDEEQDGKLNMVVGDDNTRASPFDVTDVDAWNHGGGDNRSRAATVPYSPNNTKLLCQSDIIPSSSTPQTPSSLNNYNHFSSPPLQQCPFSIDYNNSSNRGRTWSNMSTQSTSSIKSYTSSEDEIRLSQIISDLSSSNTEETTTIGSDFNALHNVCAMISENAKLVSTEASSAVSDARNAEKMANDAAQRANAATKAVRKLHKERQKLKMDVERFRTERSLLLGRVKDLLKQKKKDVTDCMKRGVEEQNELRGLLEEHVAEALMFHEKNLVCKSPGVMGKRRGSNMAEVISPEQKKDEDGAQRMTGDDSANKHAQDREIESSLSSEKTEENEKRVKDEAKPAKLNESKHDCLKEEKGGAKTDLPFLSTVSSDEEPDGIVQKDDKVSKNEDTGKVPDKNAPTEAKQTKNNRLVSNEKPNMKKGPSLSKLGGSGFSKGFGMFVEILSAGPATSSSSAKNTTAGKGDLHNKAKGNATSSSSNTFASCTSPPPKPTIVNLPLEQKNTDVGTNNAPEDKQKVKKTETTAAPKPDQKRSDTVTKSGSSKSDKDCKKNEIEESSSQKLEAIEKKENAVVDEKEEYKPLHFQGVKSSNGAEPDTEKKETNTFLNAFHRVGGGSAKKVGLLDISDDSIKDVDDRAESNIKAEKDIQLKRQPDPTADHTQYSPASVTETRYSTNNEVDRADENEQCLRSLAVPKNLESSRRPNGMMSLPPLFPDNGLGGLDAEYEQLPSLPKLTYQNDAGANSAGFRKCATPIKYSAMSRNGRFVRKVAQEPRPSSCPPLTRG